jgi:biopolymer transport protein ExbD
MPVKLTPRIATGTEPRIEVIPLIDIMFFLLASFLLVSLGKENTRHIPVQLPSATQGSLPSPTPQERLQLTVDATGIIYARQNAVTPAQLVEILQRHKQTSPHTPVVLRGDKNARYGDVAHALNTIRTTGIVNIDLATDDTPASP